MTTYIYTLTFDDSESIALADALTMYANSNQRNSNLANNLLNRLHEDAVQASGNNFNDFTVPVVPDISFKTDLFDDLNFTPSSDQS